MNIKNLSDNELHQNLLTLKSKESHIIANIISHLEEVYRRRLFAHYKCSSLYDYCIRILGYSNGEAHRKVSACKLSSHCSGVKQSIANGSLSLSNAASIQVFLNQSQKLQSQSRYSQNLENNPSFALLPINLTPEAIIERVKNKSTRECELELEKIAFENNLKISEEKPLKRNPGDKVLLKVCLDKEKLQLLQSRLNIHCEQELLQYLLEEKLKSTEPRVNVKPKARKQPSQNPRSLCTSKKAIVFKRAKASCENCNSKHFLQIDHKLSVARGGSNDIDNLRVLCRSCNQRAAIEQLGLKKMDPFINKLNLATASLQRSLPEKPSK